MTRIKKEEERKFYESFLLIEIIKRVALICEYVNKCVENIWEKQRL